MPQLDFYLYLTLAVAVHERLIASCSCRWTWSWRVQINVMLHCMEPFLATDIGWHFVSRPSYH